MKQEDVRYPAGRAVAADAVEPVPVSPVPASIPSAWNNPTASVAIAQDFTEQYMLFSCLKHGWRCYGHRCPSCK